jgi:mono/diheme cytochrome c family protein
MNPLLPAGAAFAVAVIAGQGLSQTASSPQPDPARIAAGRALFQSVGCSDCHGLAGQGGLGPMTGPRIASLPTDALVAIIRHPPQPMPTYSTNTLPDDQAREIADYLASLPKPPDAGAIPLLPAPKVSGANGSIAGKKER